MNFFEFEDRLIPLGDWIQFLVDFLVENYRGFFQTLKLPVEKTLETLEWGFTSAHPLIIMAIFAFLAWKLAGKRVTIFTLATLFFIGMLGLWEDAMITMAMVMSSVIFCGLVGVPLGIMSGRSDRAEVAIRPFLDAMQTTPAFVYLVPVVMLFSIGTVSGVLATIVFAMPPIIRLTSLGIRHVDKELIEAAQAFGATPKQTLFKVQIPLAMPSIMAGLNQTIMMSLSMVVIAALIGAGGLGSPVFQGLNTLDIGLASVGGISIVLMAMMLDRITQGLSKKRKRKK